jgi:hypothetical protein
MILEGQTMKHLYYICLLLVTLLLSACTGEKQNVRTELQSREIILINESYPKEICLSQELKDALHEKIGLVNTLTNAPESSVNCAYFSRTSTSCVKFSYTKAYPDACVIAADRDMQRKNGQINGKDVADLMIGLVKQ